VRVVVVGCGRVGAGLAAAGDVVALLRAGRGRGVALVELTLDEDAPVPGRRPAELDLPAGATVVAVVGDDQVLAGADAGPLEPADEVLALTTLQAEPDLRRFLGGQPGGSHTPPADHPACGTLPLRNGM
jgi:Trk K+ transport system NAD-binding subunit